MKGKELGLLMERSYMLIVHKRLFEVNDPFMQQ